MALKCFFLQILLFYYGILCYEEGCDIRKNVCVRKDCYESIEWNKIEEKHTPTLFVADPPVLDENGMFIYRYCKNSHDMEQSAEPFAIQKDLERCPQDFESVDGTCTKILPPATFRKSDCPFSYKLPDCQQSRGDSTWITAKRLRPFGQFFVTEFSANYMQPIDSVTYKRFEDIPYADCLIYNSSINNNIFEAASAVSCEDEYSRICTYDHLERSSRFCNFLNQNEKLECFPSSFEDADQINCICNTNSPGKCKLAELIHPYQNGKGQNCQIPLFLSDYLKSAEWESGNKLTYTYWSSNTTLSYSSRKVKLTEHGWLPDDKVECKVCWNNQTYKQPELIVEQTNNDKRLFFHVKNREFLARLFGPFIFCLTNASPSSTYSVFYAFGEEISNNAYVKVSESGFYWCEAFDALHFKQIQSNLVLVEFEHIFTITMLYRYEEGDDPTSANFANKKIQELNAEYNSRYELQIKMKWMDTPYIVNCANVYYVIHIAVKKDEKGHFKIFDKVEANLADFLWGISLPFNTTRLRSSQFCRATSMHFNGTVYKWKDTRGGSKATTDVLCLDDNHRQVKRLCRGDYLNGYEWEEAEPCTYRVESNLTSEYTSNLTDLLASEASTQEVLQNLTTLTKEAKQFKAFDVYLTSIILRRVREGEDIRLEDVTDTISNLMLTNSDVLSQSQSELNATDELLDQLDRILWENATKMESNSFRSEGEYLTNFLFAPRKVAIRGIMLLSFHLNAYEMIEINESMNDSYVYNHPGLELAVLLKNELINALPDDSKVVFSIFMKSALFNSPANVKQQRNIAKNLGVLLEQFNTSAELSIVFKSYVDVSNSICSYWRYGGMGRGEWERASKAQNLGNDLFLCDFNHVTHFGLLLMHEEVEHGNALDIITTIETCFSIIGVLGLFLTAALFKNWRQNKGNRLLLDYASLFLIQIILLFIADGFYDRLNHIACILIGSLLHYTTLSQFCFTLVIAVFQYKRYVQVFNQSMKWVLVKSYLMCYLVPALPVSILLLFFNENYNQNDLKLCYPSGNGLIFTVLLPITIILTINFIIFMKINVELFHIKKTDRFIDKSEILLRVRLVVLMFFMLGFTWIFGLLAVIFNNLFFLYVFNMTYSLQGLILFMFFIVFNKNVRRMYVYMWKKYNLTI